MATTKPRKPRVSMEAKCRYFLLCPNKATGSIQCGPLGAVRACGKCRAFYHRMGSK